MALSFSFIIPVYNRPEEIRELLESMTQMDATGMEYEILVIEDGSVRSSAAVVHDFMKCLPLRYFPKENSGPGQSRNYGMRRAQGNYFLILDSDVILPKAYLKEVFSFLQEHYVDCFGGADTASQHFTSVQKAINFSMTSFLTTGGIRGKDKAIEKFKPRSFNMGLSKAAFTATGGFAKIKIGEDLDLSIRLNEKGFKTAYIDRAAVYHKRRSSWPEFFNQVYKFGMGRPILSRWYPQTFSLVFGFPSLFLIGLGISILLAVFQVYELLFLYILYFLLIFVSSVYQNKNLKVGFLSIFATIVQFTGYGAGFLKSYYHINCRGKRPEKAFPELFYKQC